MECKCGFCNRTFHRGDFYMKVSRHDKAIVLVCDKCSKQFSDKYNHLKEVHHEKGSNNYF